MPNLYGNICTCTRCNGIVHTIRKGDTLYLLSRHYNVSVNDIMNANRNINIYNLRIGDDICIPVRRTLNEVMDSVREEVIEDIHENIQETMQEPMKEEYDTEVEEVSLMSNPMDMKLSEILDKDMTFGEFVKILKEKS